MKLASLRISSKSTSAVVCQVSVNGLHRSIPNSVPKTWIKQAEGTVKFNSSARNGLLKCFSTPKAGQDTGSAGPRLDDIDLQPIVNVQGYIQPEVPEGTEGVIFAIYDQAKMLQYVGFSKNLRNSLRTVFSRRPDNAYFYKALYFPQLDQQKLLEIRTAWFSDNGGPPPGNAVAKERAAWQEPATGLAISERGKAQAAEELAKQILIRIRLRGCKEDFVTDPELLEKGQIDFLATAEMSPEEVKKQQALYEAAQKSTRKTQALIDGKVVPFSLSIKHKFKTNGGYMFDVSATCQDKETSHRVIVGKQYYDEQAIEPEVVLEKVLGFLLQKKIPRQTEGMLLSSDFPINYFSVSEVEQFFEDFADEFSDLGKLTGGFWRFNRTQDYGSKGANESGEQLSAQFSRSWKT